MIITFRNTPPHYSGTLQSDQSNTNPADGRAKSVNSRSEEAQDHVSPTADRSSSYITSSGPQSSLTETVPSGNKEDESMENITKLCQAAEKGDIKTIRKLVRVHHVDINSSDEVKY